MLIESVFTCLQVQYLRESFEWMDKIETQTFPTKSSAKLLALFVPILENLLK